MIRIPVTRKMLRTLTMATLGLGLLAGPRVGPVARGQTSTPAQDLVLVPRDGAAAEPLSEKQKALQADSERLVRMAAELKVSVDKSNKNELSVDVVRKAEAIEALARNLKQRMKEAH